MAATPPPAGPKPPSGVDFPIASDGARSSTEPMKNILASTFYDDARKQSQVREIRNWRFGYTKALEEHVRYSLESPEHALKAAEKGLSEFYRIFEFHRQGQQYSIAEAFAPAFPRTSFHTGFIRGSQEVRPFRIPYLGRELEGDALNSQVQAWAENGTIEQDTADALKQVARSPEWIAGLKDRYFVLLGANAAMGPLQVLLALGANIIALDLKRSDIWKRLINFTRQSGGSLTFPLDKPQEGLDDAQLAEAAGCDLLSDGPSVASWINSLYPGAPFTIGNYVYLDSVLFVRVTLACDAIIQNVCQERGTSVSLAFLCTPTDYHVIPKAARDAAAANSKTLRNLFYFPFRFCPIRMLKLIPNVRPAVNSTPDGKPIYYVDGIVPDQGPNYALSKRMQHWRCLVARSKGHTVSSNVAPSTATLSVVKNRTFAWAYDGLPVICPQIEIFREETSNSVMTGLLINDLFNPQSAANPKNQLRNPYELMSTTSFHGGVWRMGYTMASTGPLSVVMHFVKVLAPLLILLLVALIYLILF